MDFHGILSVCRPKLTSIAVQGEKDLAFATGWFRIWGSEVFEHLALDEALPELTLRRKRRRSSNSSIRRRRRRSLGWHRGEKNLSSGSAAVLPAVAPSPETSSGESRDGIENRQSA